MTSLCVGLFSPRSDEFAERNIVELVCVLSWSLFNSSWPPPKWYTCLKFSGAPITKFGSPFFCKLVSQNVSYNVQRLSKFKIQILLFAASSPPPSYSAHWYSRRPYDAHAWNRSGPRSASSVLLDRPVAIGANCDFGRSPRRFCSETFSSRTLSLYAYCKF